MNSGNRHFRPPAVCRPFCILHSAFCTFFPPIPPLRPFDPGAPGLRAVLCDLPGSGQAPAGLPGQGATAPLAGVRLRPPATARAVPVPGWPAAVKAVPFAVAFPQSAPFSACSAFSAVKAVPFAVCRSPSPAFALFASFAVKAGAQFPCQNGRKKVINIKVCTWHGWKECEKGHKNR